MTTFAWTTIPGPPQSSIFGSRREVREDLLGFLTGCAREYGDLSAFTAFRILRFVLVNDPELIERLLIREAHRLRKPWDLRELKLALGEGLLTSEGDHWRRQRQAIQPAFRHDRVRGYGELIVEQAESHLDGWPRERSFDVHARMSRLTLEIVARALFGTDVADDAEEIGEALATFMRCFESWLKSTFPLPLWFPTPNGLRARRAVRRIDRVVARIIEERREDPQKGDDLLGWLLQAQEETARNAMTDRQLRDEIHTLLSAGHETTALALSYALMLLADHPEAQARAQREVRDVVGDRRPTADDAGRLAYLRQVVQEAMRLYPPAWGIGRETVEDMVLDGHPIPEGTQLLMVQWVTHRDARHFPEPERFLPERWGPDAEPPHPFAYFPFGGGPRSCVGMHFAMLEAVLVLACVLRRFEVELAPDHRLELQPAVTLRPRHGVRLVARAPGGHGT